MPDGSVIVGKPGQLHSDLFTETEANGADPLPPSDVWGFALSDGQFLTRIEALEFAAKNEPARAAYSLAHPSRGLEACTYAEGGA